MFHQTVVYWRQVGAKQISHLAVSQKAESAFNRSFIVWAILDIVTNIVGGVVDQVLNLFGAHSPHTSIKLVKVLFQCFHCLAAVGEFGSRSKREGLSRVSMVTTIVSGGCSLLVV